MSMVLEGQIQEGQRLCHAQKFAEAKALLQPLVGSPDTPAGAWCFLGYAQLGLNELAAAESAFRQAIDRSPNDPLILYGIGMVLGRENHFGESIPFLEKVLTVQQNFEAARLLLVDHLIREGRKKFTVYDTVSGEQLMGRAIHLSPGDAEPVAELAERWIEHGNSAKAKAVVQGAMGHVPMTPRLQRVAASLHLVQAPTAVADPVAPAAPVADVIHPSSAAVVMDPPKPAQTPQDAPKVQMVPCAGCKLPVMPWAVKCPHCGLQIVPDKWKSAQQIAEKKTWQEIWYKLMSIYWIASAAYSIFAGVQAMHQFENEMHKMGLRADNGFMNGGYFFYWIVGTLQAVLGIGLLIEIEALQFVARLVCYLMVLAGIRGVLFSLMLGHPVAILLNAFQLAAAGFMVYLINYVAD